MVWTRRLAAPALLGLFLCVGPVRAAEDKEKAKDTETENPNRVAVFRLTEELKEAPPQFDLGLEQDQFTLYELLNRFAKARKDPRLKAVVLIFDRPQIGWAQRQELRQAIRDLKAGDKDVYCLLDEAEESTYLLTTAASRIYLAPTGNLDLIGMHVEQSYLKGLLDKIGVQADIEHMGAYKGAGEPFTRTGPSEEAKEMLNWLLKDLFDQMVQQIAEDRQLPPDQVRQLIDKGPFTAKEAKDAKLVDEIGYPEEFVDKLKERYGKNLEIVHNYGQRKLPEVDLSSPFGLFKFFGEMMSKTKSGSKPQVAVVYAEGMIVTGKTGDELFGGEGLVGSTNMRRLFARIRDNDQIKAVVLRVNSPGGSAVASDIIWHATQTLGDDKPFVVSMGNVAASGGYYISAGATRIFADPGTITGSIGVVGGKLVTQGLWNWMGITFHETTLGKNADLYNTNRPFDENQRAIVRKYMADTYDAFKDRVTQGRKDKIKGDLEALAGGRVYTGRQAKDKGLVDQLGTLQDAIKFAAAEGKVTNYDVLQMPEPKNFLEMFIKGLTGEGEDGEGGTVQVAHRGWLLKTPAAAEAIRALGRIDPVKSRGVIEMLLQLEMLADESTLLVMPNPFQVR